MEYFRSFFSNTTLWLSVFSIFLAQISKIVTNLIVSKKFDAGRALNNGGMPSSHSAGVSCLAIHIGLTQGFNSSYFAIASILAVIVMHDASTLRNEAGKHAKLLNEIMEEFQDFFKNSNPEEQLKTLLGHSKLQVFVGFLLGVAVAIVGFIIFN